MAEFNYSDGFRDAAVILRSYQLRRHNHALSEKDCELVFKKLIELSEMNETDRQKEISLLLGRC